MGNMPSAGASARNSMILGGVGVAADAASGYLSGIGQAQQYSYQAQVSRNNATLARGEIGSTLDAGNYAGIASKIKTGQVLAGQKVAYAANGVDVGVGTPVNVAASTQRIGDMDAAMVRYNAARSAYGLELEAAGHDQQAALYDRAAKGAKRAGITRGLNSIISGASSLSDKWSGYKLSGAVKGNTRPGGNI